MHILRFLLDDIFGCENFIGDGLRKTKTSDSNTKTGYTIIHEHFLIYGKDKNVVKLKGKEKDFKEFKNPDNDEKGAWKKWKLDAPGFVRSSSSFFGIKNPLTGEFDYPKAHRQWRFSRETFEKLKEEGRVQFKKEGGFFIKEYKKDVKSGYTHLLSLFASGNEFINAEGTEDLKKLFDGVCLFSYAKPVAFMKKIIRSTTDAENKDIVLDMFGGSGSMAHALMEQNQEDGGDRSYICVQKAEKCSDNSIAKEEGYNTISELCLKRIARAALKISKESGNTVKSLKIFKVASPKRGRPRKGKIQKLVYLPPHVWDFLTDTKKKKYPHFTVSFLVEQAITHFCIAKNS